jgi:hypothetical protein
VRETASKPVEFVTDDDVDLSKPHTGHELVETFTRRLHTELYDAGLQGQI